MCASVKFNVVVPSASLSISLYPNMAIPARRRSTAPHSPGSTRRLLTPRQCRLLRGAVALVTAAWCWGYQSDDYGVRAWRLGPASSVAPFLRPFRSRGGRRRIPTIAPALQRPLSSPPCQIQRLKPRRWRRIQFSVYLRSILFDLCSLVP